jgi:zinc and cadmium transporter
MSFLVPFAAGNFIYIGASDLVPEIKKHENLRTNIIHLLSLTAGIALMAANRVFLG